MSELMAELRRAEATILELVGTQAMPWERVQFGPTEHVQDSEGAFVAQDLLREEADLIALSVSVLVEAVLPIIQRAIELYPGEPSSAWQAFTAPNALLLARAVPTLPSESKDA